MAHMRSLRHIKTIGLWTVPAPGGADKHQTIGKTRATMAKRDLHGYVKYISGWWFGTCFIFPYIGNNPS